MLAPRTGGDAHCGPFFEITSLTAVSEELVKLLVQAASTFTMFFEATGSKDYVMQIAFMEAQGEWMEKFLKRPFDRAQLDELRTLATAAAFS